MYIQAKDLVVGDRFKHVNRPRSNDEVNDIGIVHKIGEGLVFFHYGNGHVEFAIYKTDVVEKLENVTVDAV